MDLRFYLLSLGCAKNLVDSEMMTGLLLENGYEISGDPALAEIIIVNTCGFIQAAKEEAIAHILELARYKKEGVCNLLLAVGCMAEKYAGEMAASMPEIDAFLGTGEYEKILDLLPKGQVLVTEKPYLLRRLATPPYSAYLKIAEGCDNHCSYCLIPQLRGPYRSRPLADLLEEARHLLARGVKELILIAQDTTSYGLDIYGKMSISRLLEELAALPFLWIRLLYSYPGRIDENLLQVMAAHENICHYLDIPIQHGDEGILQAMNRPGGRTAIDKSLALSRKYLPDLALRTTVMVGFPGEEEKNWLALLDFLRGAGFDWVGVFAYCREQDTAAALLPLQVAEKTKMRRREQTLELLSRLSAEKQKRWLGQELQVLVEEAVSDKPGWCRGRTQYQAPEVDGSTFFPGPDLIPGQVVKVKVTATDIYDLIGEII
ncbi:MAG: 30S ribosomal protein S12 methylthiotransferase RimO [Clostridiales bacterium]|jgi:ribosomal protein S12 methylthiotransferase|nr:30S ribosomal protein S12 methylthiotransferase RimO [Clostridiales bacterium]